MPLATGTGTCSRQGRTAPTEPMFSNWGTHFAVHLRWSDAASDSRARPASSPGWWRCAATTGRAWRWEHYEESTGAGGTRHAASYLAPGVAMAGSRRRLGAASSPLPSSSSLSSASRANLERFFFLLPPVAFCVVVPFCAEPPPLPRPAPPARLRPWHTTCWSVSAPSSPLTTLPPLQRLTPVPQAEVAQYTSCNCTEAPCVLG
jgi:hypothetical protein